MYCKTSYFIISLIYIYNIKTNDFHECHRDIGSATKLLARMHDDGIVAGKYENV